MAVRHILSTLAFSLGLAGTQAQITASEPFTNKAAGITFQQGSDPSNGYAFGIALPEEAGNDFIGRITAPISTSLRDDELTARCGIPEGWECSWFATQSDWLCRP